MRALYTGTEHCQMCIRDKVIIGQTVKMGYYAQEIASEKNEDENEIDLSYMDPNQRVIDYAKDLSLIHI